MADFGYNYNTWKGENLSAGTDTATYAFELWRDSSGHNSNMLNPNFGVIGVARTYESDSTNGWYWTADFGGFDGDIAELEFSPDGQSPMSTLPASADVSLVAGWNHACYAGSQQAIDAALAPITSQVLAVYRLRADGGYDRWFPGKPDVSTIAMVNPFESLLILMAGGASWVQDVSAMSPTGSDLVMGWNGVCYGGLAGSVDEDPVIVSGELSILYTLSSDQVWRRYVPGRPDITNINDLGFLVPVLALVTHESGPT